MDSARNNYLKAYNGAWIYPVDSGWEANLHGYHYIFLFFTPVFFPSLSEPRAFPGLYWNRHTGQIR